MTRKLAFAVVVAVVLSGCPRRVVLDPEVAAALNSKDWTVKREPGQPASVVPTSVRPAQPGAPAPSAVQPKKN
jgi:hypothetical protein